MKKTFLLLATAIAFILTGCDGNKQPDGPGPDPVDPNAPGIRSADDFLSFAEAVNAGKSTAEWENEEGWVNLLADIDFAGVTDWTPVGDAIAPWGSSYNPVVTEGHAFTGKFDGNAHHIKNLALVDNVTVEGRHFGLFGYLGKGAIVQNFVIENNCSLTVKSSVAHSAGVIAGLVYDAAVRDVTSYAPMTYQGSATGLLHMALIGGIYANEENCTVDSVHNYGKITATNTANLNAGATGIHAAGIVGFANALNSGEDPKSVTVSSCNNYGDMESQAGRTAGIVGAANARTLISDCENRGNQLNTMPKDDGGRLGNIVCFTNNGSSISGCKNYGNLISTRSGRVGGIVSLANAATYSNNENYGEIISDSQYRGVFFGYINTATTWTGGKASGKVGRYNGGTYVYDLYEDAQKEKYLGPVSGAGSINASNIVYDIATGDTPIQPDPSLDVQAGLRIFFIGNSFTKDAVELLPNILHEKGITDVQLVHMYYGGRTIPEYVSGWSSATDYKCYVCNPGASSWSELTGKSLAVVAATGKWDYVTIQEHTGRSIAWGRTAAEQAAEVASVQELVNKVKSAQSAVGGNPKLYYILSQAYHDLSKAQNVDKNFTTTDEMWTKISAVGRAIVEGCGFDGVISTGAMLQNLRTSGLKNSNGLTRDGYHMDNGISRFGAACTVFETLIGPVKNMLLDGVVCGPSVDSFTGTAWTTAVTETRAPVALHAARYAIQKPYEVTDMKGEGAEQPEVPETPEDVSIASVDELVAFAARVNSGDAKAKTANVTLTADLNLSSLTAWTPIGNVTATGNNLVATAPEGNVFSGTFDGGNHTISGFKANATLAAGKTWGFFGYLSNATVKNFTLVADVTLQAGGAADAGIVAGTLLSSTVQNVTVQGKADLKGTTVDNVRFAVGGIAGFAISAYNADADRDTYIKGCNVDLTVTASSGTNTKNGATGCHYGGIVGFSTNLGKDASHVHIENCTNGGTITASIGRSSGIAGAANYGTLISGCVNNASQVSTMNNGRIANIACILGGNSGITDCINNGSVTTTVSNCQAAGFVALLNDATCFISGGRNNGDVICAFVTDSNGRDFRGLLVANFSNFKEVNGTVVSGRLGKYVADSTPQWVDVTADNYIDGKYIGYWANDTAKAKIKNTSYVAPE
ncbi:MAG: DUF4886 domain-containing protein [Bacteroidales bacterium]|nr:DUF4886 domain-containing protein [Bacteroidales bacterium]